jgi:hypothetical protein
MALEMIYRGNPVRIQFGMFGVEVCSSISV